MQHMHFHDAGNHFHCPPRRLIVLISLEDLYVSTIIQYTIQFENKPYAILALFTYVQHWKRKCMWAKYSSLTREWLQHQSGTFQDPEVKGLYTRPSACIQIKRNSIIKSIVSYAKIWWEEIIGSWDKYILERTLVSPGRAPLATTFSCSQKFLK